MGVVIERLTVQLVDLPTIRPHRLSMATLNYQTLAIIRIVCSDGIEGIGEATTIGGLSYGEESPESIRDAINVYIAPLLKGQPADNLNLLDTLVRRHIKGNPIARSAVETALLDAHGKRLGVPVSALLGGAVEKSMPVLWTLASGDTEKDIEEGRRCIEQRRHRVFKLKIGSRSVRDDVHHVVSIKEALGEEISIRVDVNQAWDEVSAIRGIAALQEAGIDLIEQPLPLLDVAGLVRLANRFQVPILADESIHTLNDILAFHAAGFHGAVALKIAKSNGPWSIQPLARTALSAGFGLYGGTMLEGAIGTAASIHSWSTLGPMQWGTEMFGPLLLKDDIVTEPLAYHDFSVDVPDKPGLGVTLDEDKLAFYTRQDS